MERLTISDYGKLRISPPSGTKGKERPSYMDLYHRLAAIEDILGGEYELDWLKEVCEIKNNPGGLMGLIEKLKKSNDVFLEVASRYSELGDYYRLKELVDADREGRCVVLPCKKGDTVWRIVYDSKPHITKDRCTSIKVENKEVWVNLIGDRVMGGWNFGKLLFLNEKEAEATLKAREQK